MSLPPVIRQHLEQHHSLHVESSRSLSGGCIHQAQTIETQRGTFFLKYNEAKQAHNFEVEKQGLGILKESGAVRVPTVYGTHEVGAHAYFLAEFIPSGAKASDFWEQLGTALAHLHLRSTESFGLDHNNYIGALPQSNRPWTKWAEFYQRERFAASCTVKEID
ncbi:MAG: fructosamine kinase family protein, partial [Bacteroidota bacterium]